MKTNFSSTNRKKLEKFYWKMKSFNGIIFDYFCDK